MSIATQSQKITQANQIQATQRPTSNPLVVAFDRFTSMIKGQPCTTQGHPNGHITQANATSCAQARAMDYLATLPEDTTQEDALASLGEVQIMTLDRFMCLTTQATEGTPLSLKCKFGHKTQAQAESCVGTQARASIKAATLVQVTLGGALQATQEPTQPTQATQEPTQATQPTQANKNKPEASKLHSGSQGQTSKA